MPAMNASNSIAILFSSGFLLVFGNCKKRKFVGSFLPQASSAPLLYGFCRQPHAGFFIIGFKGVFLQTRPVADNRNLPLSVDRLRDFS
jgi:hypothetical protein